MDWYISLAFLLIGVGVVLLLAEFFLPTGGILVVCGIAAWVIAVGLILLYGDTQEAIAAVFALCVGGPIAWTLTFNAWKRLALKTGLDSETIRATALDIPELAELDQLKGRYGKTVTPMRPSGSVEIDGRRVDAMTEGMMLDANVPVKCVDIRAGRVIVRQADPPALSDMNFDSLN
jgi:membrane-bound ClpP family serine protease